MEDEVVRFQIVQVPIFQKLKRNIEIEKFSVTDLIITGYGFNVIFKFK